jgi:hypothetical protein
MNYLTEKRLAHTEQRARQIGMISKPAVIIHLIIVDPPRCEHKPCKSPDCNCP